MPMNKLKRFLRDAHLVVANTSTAIYYLFAIDAARQEYSFHPVILDQDYCIRVL